MAAVMLLVACVLTTAVVSVWLTAVVGTTVKSHVSNRQVRQLQEWQRQVMRVEDQEQRP